MIFIHAGCASQARAAAHWLELHPENWRYVCDGNELLGTDHPKVILFGTYWEHPRKAYIMEMMNGHRAFVSRLEDQR